VQKIKIQLYFTHYLPPARTGVLLSLGITLSIINSILTSKYHFNNGQKNWNQIIKSRCTVIEDSNHNHPYTTPEIVSEACKATLHYI